MRFLVAFLLFWVTPVCALASTEFQHPSASGLRLSEDGSTLFSHAFHKDGSDRLRGWKLPEGTPIDLSELLKGPTPSISGLSPDGKKLLVSRSNGDGKQSRSNFEIWRLDGNLIRQTAKWWPQKDEFCYSASFIAQKCVILTNKAIETRSLTGRLEQRVPLNAKIEDGKLSGDGKWVLANVAGRGTLFNARSGCLHHRLQSVESPNGDDVSCLDEARFCPDGRFVINTHYFVGMWINDEEGYYHGGETAIWNTNNGTVFWPDSPYNPHFLPDGRHLISGFGLWDIETRKNVKQFASPWMVENQIFRKTLPDIKISSDGRIWALLDTSGNISVHQGEVNQPA